MLRLEQITREIAEVSEALEAAEMELIELALEAPGDLWRFNTLCRCRAGLLARLDRLTQEPDAVPLRLAG